MEGRLSQATSNSQPKGSQRSRMKGTASSSGSKSRLTSAIKNLKQLTRPTGKKLLYDEKYVDFGDLMQEEDFNEPRYKQAAQKYQKLIKNRNYENITMEDIGLIPQVDEERDIMSHFRFIYG